MKKEISPEIRIVAVIKIKIFNSGTPISCFIAADEPVRVFDIKNKAKKEKHIVKMFIIPSMKRNCLLLDFVKRFPMTAICPLLSAGKNKLNGEKIAEARIALAFFILTSLSVFCLGT